MGRCGWLLVFGLFGNLGELSVIMDIKDLIKQSSQNLETERKQTAQQKKQALIDEQRERQKQAQLLTKNVAKFKHTYWKYNELDTTLTDLCETLLVYEYIGLPVDEDDYLRKVGDLLVRMKQKLDILIELCDYAIPSLGFNKGAFFNVWVLRKAHLLNIYINMHDLAGGGEKFFALISHMGSGAME